MTLNPLRKDRGRANKMPRRIPADKTGRFNGLERNDIVILYFLQLTPTLVLFCMYRASCLRPAPQVFSSFFTSFCRAPYVGLNRGMMTLSNCPAGAVDSRPVFFFDIDNCVSIQEKILL